MAMFGRSRGRIELDQTQALSHPVRIGILGVFTKDPVRSLAASDLLDDLIAEDPDMFGEFSVSQVAYHRARLQDAQLLPTR
jgi:hypothetical protein